MTYQDILVHVDDSEAMPARVGTALELAERFGAHLTGVYVDPGIALPALMDVPIAPNLIDELEAEHQQRCEEAERRFRETTSHSDVSSEWRLAKGELADTLAHHARYADLVILGQEGGDDQKMVVGGLPDTVVLTCGRPALVVPYIGTKTPPGKFVIVAWNGSREAARAVNDALPMIKDAEKVEVVCIGADDEEHLPGADLVGRLRDGLRGTARWVEKRKSLRREVRRSGRR